MTHDYNKIQKNFESTSLVTSFISFDEQAFHPKKFSSSPLEPKYSVQPKLDTAVLNSILASALLRKDLEEK